MHVTIINEKRGCEFKREQGELYERVWKEENKDKNDVNVL